MRRAGPSATPSTAPTGATSGGASGSPSPTRTRAGAPVRCPSGPSPPSSTPARSREMMTTYGTTTAERIALLDLRVQGYTDSAEICAGGEGPAAKCAELQWPAGVRAEAPTVADASAWLLGELAPRQCEAAAEMARAEAARAAEEAGAIAVEAYLRAAEERLAAGEPIGWSTSPHDLPDRPDTPWSV